MTVHGYVFDTHKVIIQQVIGYNTQDATQTYVVVYFVSRFVCGLWQLLHIAAIIVNHLIRFPNGWFNLLCVCEADFTIPFHDSDQVAFITVESSAQRMAAASSPEAGVYLIGITYALPVYFITPPTKSLS